MAQYVELASGYKMPTVGLGKKPIQNFVAFTNLIISSLYTYF